ncbi:MAG: ABC transporter substrate-binding protein [Sciscionella sp.]
MGNMRTATVAGIAALAMGLTACSAGGGTGAANGSGSSAAPRNGGHVTVALAEAPDALDPTTAQTYVGRVVLINMCQKLYDINANAQIVPELATGMPQISKDGKAYTLHLRHGVRFNDGTKFDAAAVKTTLERDKNDKRSSRASSLSTLQKITVANPTTIKLTLSKPYAPLTAVLAARAGMIESPAQLKKLGDNFSKHPVCVGPFSFASRASSDRIELKKSQYYYDKSKVHLDRVTFEVVTQPNVRATNIRAGSIDVADRIQPPQVPSLRSAQGVTLKSAVSLGYQGITINVANSNGAGKPGNHTVGTPLAQEQLRKAFELSLDRNTINKAVFDGMYVPGCTPISPASPFHTNAPCSKPDLAKAKQIVKASGMPTPITVNLVVQAANNINAKLAQVIQQMAGRAGFRVHVAPTEFTTALSQAQAGKFDAFQIGWSGRIDPDQNIAPFWGAKSLLNYSGANYPDVTSLLAKARSTTDMATRKQLYHQLVQTLNKHLNIIYLYHQKFILGIRSNLTGVHYYPDNLIRLQSAGFTSGS